MIKRKEERQGVGSVQGKGKVQGSMQKQKLPEDFLRELDGKKCKVYVSAGAEVWEYVGVLRVARYDVKVELEYGGVMYIHKAFLIGAEEVREG